MKRAIVLIGLIISFFLAKGQITLIGKNMLNGQAVNQSKLLVYSEGVCTQTLNTGASSDFMIKLPFGKIYHVFILNRVSPLLNLEIIANTIPADKYAYRMTYELIVPMVDKMDPDIDTTVFAKPFHRVVFDGKSRLVPDTLYNSNFANHILKKQNMDRSALLPPGSAILAGKIKCEEKPSYDFSLNSVELLDARGEVIRKLNIDRLGYFSLLTHQNFQNLTVRLNLKDSTLNQFRLQLLNDKNILLSNSKAENSHCTWLLNDSALKALYDNNFSSHLGGKIVISSQKEKRFFSERPVYLLNKRFTVLEKTSTNIIGSFVFNDVIPDEDYYIAVDRSEFFTGEKSDLLNKDDHFVCGIDSLFGNKRICRVTTKEFKLYNELLVGDNELQMDVNANIFGDNVNNPIGNLKIILLNDAYEPIDSVLTNDFGSFKFKYLPFLKRFYLDADNSDNILDVFRNILIYSSEEHLIKIMTHQKGKKFIYKPLKAEMTEMREVELEDPWLRLMDEPEEHKVGIDPVENKLIVENIHFENNQTELSVQAKEVLDKIILVLNDQKQIKIEIGAHTDSKGNEIDNLKLSQQRAKAVHAYILAAGIASDRLFSKGYGESMPLVVCDEKHPCSEADFAKNRRIEFKIINNQSAK